MTSTDLPRTTILLIDGYENDRTYYAGWLKNLLPDYDILQARDGQSGLAQHQSHPVDCLIVESALSNMSAFEVLLRAVPLVRHQKVAFVMFARGDASEHRQSCTAIRCAVVIGQTAHLGR